jgi:hypothetical protein
MPQEPLFAAAKLIAFSVGDSRWPLLQSNAVPPIFDKLDAFSPSELKRALQTPRSCQRDTFLMGDVQPSVVSVREQDC